MGKVPALSAKNSLISSAFDQGEHPNACDKLTCNKRLPHHL